MNIDIATALGVSPVTVCKWLSRAEHDGVETLRSRTGHGRPAKLTRDQLWQIPEFLWHGAEAYGFRGEVWICGRIAQEGLWQHLKHVELRNVTTRDLEELHLEYHLAIGRIRNK